MKMWLCLRVTFQVAVYEGRGEMSISYPLHIPCKSIRVFLFSISDRTSCLASHLPSTHSYSFTTHFPHSVQTNILQSRDSAWPPAPLGWDIICNLWWRSKRWPWPEFLAICRFRVWRSLEVSEPCINVLTSPVIVVACKVSETTPTLLPNWRTGFWATCDALHREERW